MGIGTVDITGRLMEDALDFKSGWTIKDIHILPTNAHGAVFRMTIVGEEFPDAPAEEGASPKKCILEYGCEYREKRFCPSIRELE